MSDYGQMAERVRVLEVENAELRARVAELEVGRDPAEPAELTGDAGAGDDASAHQVAEEGQE